LIPAVALFICGDAMAQDFQIGGDAQQETVIPLEVRPTLGLFVVGYLNGHGPYRFSIGVVQNTFLTQEVVKDAGLATRDTGIGYDANTDEREQRFEVIGTTLRLGDSDTSLDGAYVLPEHNTAAYDPVPHYGGRLGVEVFRNRVVRLDLSHHQLVLSRRANGVDRPDAIEVPLEQSAGGAVMDRFPAITMSLDGQPGRFRIDFARAGVTFSDNSPLGRDLMSRAKHPYTALLWSPNGIARVQGAWVAANIEGHRLGAVEIARHANPTQVSLHESRRLYTREPALDGVVGLEVLARFDISIDNLAGKAWLVPREEGSFPCHDAPTPQTHGNVGFVPWDYKGQGVVLMLTEGSPADAAGVQPGDQIVSINDGTVAGYQAHLDVTCGASASEPVKLVFRNASGVHTVVLTPAEY